ncbi:hypothetical protein ACEOWG_001141 [Bacillus cereus]
MKEAPIIDYENLDKKIEELRARNEAHRQARIARGLPPERPNHFVDREVSNVLADKVEHLFDYFKKYGALLARTRKLQPTEYATIQQKYGDCILLLSEAIDLKDRMSGNCLKDLLETLKRIDPNEISYEKASREIYCTFKVLELRSRSLNQFSEEPLPDIDEERLAQLQSDESFLQSEVQRYLDHYESIKHLI